MGETTDVPARGTPEWRAEVLRLADKVAWLADAHECANLRAAAAMLRLEEWRTP
jgi:hypothetical protein